MQTIVPLDPDSPKGREVAERLTELLAEFRLAIAARERRAAAGTTDTTRRAAA